jgi:hypothetical protein
MTKKSQVQKFRDKARELGADESEVLFEATLARVARAKLSPDTKRPAAKGPAKRKKR